MKTKFFTILSLLAVLLCFCFFPVCAQAKSDKKTSGTTKKSEVTVDNTVQLNRTTKIMYVTKSFSLKLLNAKKRIKWSSSDTNIATVEDGRVTGISKGFVYIYADCDGVRYSCHVKVKEPQLNVTKRRLRIKNSFPLIIKGTKVLSYQSSNEKIVKISSDGIVTGKKSGTTEITCVCDNGKSYTCSVEVYKNVLDIKEPSFSDMAPTTRMSFKELVGDNGIYDKLDKMPAPKTYKLIVDLYYKLVMAYTTDENGEYTVPVRYMLCSPGKSTTPTPTGTFKMENYRLRFHEFTGTSSYAQYWSQIRGRIFFHSTLYTSANAKDYTTPSYDNLGTAASHGCIRLAAPDARWIYYNVAPGSKIVIRKGSSDDKDTAAIRKKMVLVKRPSSRPTLKKGEIPDTDNWTIEEVPQEFKYVQGSQNGGD